MELKTMNQEICERVLDEIVEGRSIAQICCDPGMPAISTVYGWLRGTGPEHVAFREAYHRAIQTRKYMLFEDIEAIVDDASGDFVELRNENGQPYLALDRGNIKRSMMRIAVMQREYDALSRKLPAAAPAQPVPATFNITEVNFMDLPADLRAGYRRHPRERDGSA